MTSSYRASEEKAVALQIGTALQALSGRLNGVSIEGVPPLVHEMAMESPEVSVLEAIELVQMLARLVADAVGQTERLRAALFDAHPKMIAILLSFLQAPQALAPGDVFADFFRVVLNTLTDIVCACCQEVDGSRTQTTTTANGAVIELHGLASRAVCAGDGVQLSLGLLQPTLPEVVQQSAAELLFALLVRVEEARSIVAHPRCFRVLYGSLNEQRSPSLRSFVAACVREMANTHAALFFDDEAALDTLLRLIALDESLDVRALAAETVETMFQAQPAALIGFKRTRELAAVMVDRLGQEPSVEGQVAQLKLLETVLMQEAAVDMVTDEHGPDVSDPQSSSRSVPAAAHNKFSEFLLAGYADRALVQLIKPQTRAGSLAARNLRLLIQVSPFYRAAAFGLVQHFPTLSKLLKLCVHLATDPVHQHDVVTLITRTEVGIVLGLCLSQDPRCRQLLESQLLEHPHYMQQLRSSALSNLNSADLDYFEDVHIRDVTGQILNTLSRVEWDGTGRPTKQSVHDVFLEQEDRWASSTADVVASTRGNSDVGKQLKTEDAARKHRLSFILLTYAVHLTLDVSGASHTTHSQGPDAAVAHNHGEEGDRGEGYAAGAVVNAMLGEVGGPLPTRSSMLREWTAHPQKAGAVQRAAERAAATPGPASRDAASTTQPRTARTDYSSQSFAPHQDPYNTIRRSGGARSVASVVLTSARPGGAQRASSSKSPERAPAPGRKAVFNKFDDALKLALQLARHFFVDAGGGASSVATRTVVFESSGDGFARRQVGGVSSSSAPPSASNVRSWSIAQLKEGDLFYFQVPLVDLSATALEQVRSRAIRHLNTIKKAFVITPQSAKARRWLLFDMSTNIMPGIIHALSQLIELFAVHGDEAAKFPVIMFRDQQLRDEERALPTETSLTAGNLFEILDQVRFYFANVGRGDAHRSAAVVGGFAPREQSVGSVHSVAAQQSTFLNDLERKIGILSAQRFDGRASRDGGAEGAFETHPSPSIGRPSANFAYDSDDESTLIAAK